MADQIKRLSVYALADTTNYVDGMTKLDAANVKATASSDQATAAISKTGQAFDQTTTRIVQTSTGIEKWNRQLIDGYAAQNRLEQGMRNYNLALEKGAVDHEKAVAAMQGLANKTGLTVTAAEASAKGFTSLAAVIAKNSAEGTIAAKVANDLEHAHGNMNLRFQEGVHSLRSFGEMVVAGQNPLKAFSMEAGRAGTVLYQMDEGFRSGLTSVIAWGVPLLAIGAGIAVVVDRMISLNAEARQLTETATAYNSHSISPSDLQTMAHNMASGSPFSRSDAMQAITELQKYRDLSAQTMAGIASVAVPMAEATGQKLPDATKALADAAQAGYAGIQKLEQAYGMLTPSQMTYVRQLSEAGHQTEAFKVALDALDKQMSQAAHSAQGEASSGFRALGDAIQGTLDRVANSDSMKTMMRFFSLSATAAAAMLTPQSPIDAARQRAADAYGNLLQAKNAINPAGDPLIASEQRKNLVGAQKEYDDAREALDKLTASEKAHTEEIQKQQQATAAAAKADADRAQADAAKIAADQTRAKYYGENGIPGLVSIAGMTNPYQAQRSQVMADIAQKRLTAGADQNASLDEEQRGRLAIISAQATAQITKHIRDIDLQTEAQRRLTAATGDYNKTTQATIENEMARERIANPAMTNAQAARIRADLETQAQLKQQDANKKYLDGLDAKIASQQQQVDSLLGRGKSAKLLDMESQLSDAQQKGADLSAVRSRVTDYNTGVMNLQRLQFASQVAPEISNDNQLKQIDDLRQHIGELGLSETQQIEVEKRLTDATVQANLQRLRASKDGFDGMQAALFTYAQSSESAGQTMFAATTAGLKSIETGLLDLTTASKKPADAFRTMVTQILTEMERLLVVKPLMGQLMALMGVNTGAASGAAGAGTSLFTGGGLIGGISSLFSPGSNTVDMAALNAPLPSDIAAAANVPAQSAAGSFLSDAGSFFSGLFHSGDIVGNPTAGRMVNPGVFVGAPRYHSGGVVGDLGLSANEVPAILQTGEEVLTASDPRHSMNLASPPPANSNSSGSVFHPGAIQVHAPGATASDAEAIAQKVAERVSDLHWQQRAPSIIAQASNHAVTQTTQQVLRNTRIGRAIQGR